ncbi:hypothetical protein K2Z84_04670, partial [Candidatus Binatia bacterium]|nr:hypothetical protein [Candidatus Binatia bacterium]
SRTAARHDADMARRGVAASRGRPASPPTRRGRSWLRIAASVTIVFGALAVAAAAGSNVLLRKLQPMMLSGMSDVLGRKVGGGDASLLLAGGPGVRLANVTIAEDARFGSGEFASVRSAALQLDPGALLRGQVRGDVHLDGAKVQLLRDAGGTWNVETLSGRHAAAAAVAGGVPLDKAAKDGAAAKERAVRLASASISNGTLEIRDQVGHGRDVTLRDLDASYTGTDPTKPARITLASMVGNGNVQRIALSGEIGPFEGGGTPRWAFDEVKLQQVRIADIPGAPADVVGELTFDGTLASTGSGFDDVLGNASGDGAIGICCGELRERNLTVELLTALTEHAEGDAATTAADVLARAKQSPALAAALAGDATPFEDISGDVSIAQGNVTFEGLQVETSLFQAKATGSVSRGGALDAHGTVALSPAATAAIVALVPQSQRMFGAGGTLEVPFSVAGRWPDVDLRVDVRTAIARLMAPLDPRRLAIGLRVTG